MDILAWLKGLTGSDKNVDKELGAVAGSWGTPSASATYTEQLKEKYPKTWLDAINSFKTQLTKLGSKAPKDQESLARAILKETKVADYHKAYSGSAPASVATAKYFWPVAGGAPDKHGFKDWAAPRSGGRKHEGTDIFAPAGTPLVATETGTVTKVTPTDKGLGGLTVTVKGASGYTYYYAHLSRVDVKVGQSVKAGVTVGAVGNSGNAKNTPAHLHFQVWGPKGTLMQPATWYNAIKPQMGVGQGSYEGSLASLKRNVGPDSSAYVAEYVMQLNAMGYDGPKGEEFIAWAIMNNKSPADLMGMSGEKGMSEFESRQVEQQRHDFKGSVVEVYRDMLGVAPSSDTIKMWENRYNATGGLATNINDVREYIRNSNQFKQRIESQVAPAVIKQYQDMLGIADISKIPSTFNYVMDNIKSGKWNLNDVESFIVRSPQYAARQQEATEDRLEQLAQAKLGISSLSEMNKNFLMPKVNQGWMDAQIVEYMRKNPDFQARFPGIRADETPDQYDQKISLFNSKSWELRGRAFDPKDADDLKQLEGAVHDGVKS